MDPQGRFTNEYQALRYVNQYTDELAAAYGKADESGRKQTGWLAKQIGQLLGYLGAYLVALGERMKLDKEVPLIVQQYANDSGTTVTEKNRR